MTWRCRKGFIIPVDCVSPSPAAGEPLAAAQARRGLPIPPSHISVLAQPGEFISPSQPQNRQNKTLKHHGRWKGKTRVNSSWFVRAQRNGCYALQSLACYL